MISLKNAIYPFLFFFILSCADYQTNKSNDYEEKKYFSSKGFALIYDDNYYKDKLVNKRLKNDEIEVMHSFLKINTPVKIINPYNNKVIETKIYRKASYPKIFNIVISKKIATELSIDSDNPYIEILEFKKNKTFIAKETNIFEEEKNVAEKAPIKEIEVNVLSDITIDDPKKVKVKNNKFTILIADFYYHESAINLKQHLEKETQNNNFSINKINENNYRLSIGPFENFNALKSIYISLNNLGFDDLNVYRE